jgi:hypothetical protein
LQQKGTAAMQNDFVKQLETECEKAITKVVARYVDNLPPQIAHLMAKAAVTVLEAAIDDE